jgi:hypothetical protein
MKALFLGKSIKKYFGNRGGGSPPPYKRSEDFLIPDKYIGGLSGMLSGSSLTKKKEKRN